MVFDLLSLLSGCISIYLTKDLGSLTLTILLGAFLAGICWYACSVYTHLWNKHFQVTLRHHFYCAFASVCTLLFTILFSSLYYIKDAALLSISIWQRQINADEPWGARTFAKAYDSVMALGTEDFSEAPTPESPGSFIPTTQNESRLTVASTFAREAGIHFDQSRPFLSKIARSNPGIPSDVILEDVKTWHETNPNYPPSRAIEIAAQQVKLGLVPQVPRLISLSRISLVLLFLLVQIFPFGLIGWSAYRDIEARF